MNIKSRNDYVTKIAEQVIADGKNQSLKSGPDKDIADKRLR